MNKLSIIIVNYRSADLMLEAIASVQQFNPELDFEIIVVDNYSGLDEKERVHHKFPEVHWVSLPYNAGFARANNAGMKVAAGDVYLLLNPDTLAIDDSVTQCYGRLSSSDHAGAGIQLVNAQYEPQISGNYFMKGGLNHLLPIPYWGGLIRWLGYRTKTKIPNIQEAKKTEEVDWITGAFLMVKKTAVEAAGMMDEDFFLYAEEVEWCSRLKKAGKLCIFGDLRMIHLEGALINKEQNSDTKGYYNLSDKKGLQLIVSNHLRVRKQYGVFWFLFLLLNYSWGVFFYGLMNTLHRLFTLRNPFGEWNKIGGFAKNVARLWALAPRMISNKPHFYKMF